MNRVKLVNSNALFRKSYFQIPKKSKGKTSNDQDFIFSCFTTSPSTLNN